ncbi:ATP synthase gamma chain [Striga asiatica]|uniref:ATP synthase gamma chain n=1 Tax=Striga asiatica TaxID=4170 RepID=A0A5A7R2T9_STRAF|nr:ATP synthase gamma chain [Striga asiatica]
MGNEAEVQEGSGTGEKYNEKALALINVEKPNGQNLDRVGSSMDESSLGYAGGKNSNSFQSLETIPEEAKIIQSQLVDVDIQHGPTGASVSERKHTFKRKTKLGKQPVVETMVLDAVLEKTEKLPSTIFKSKRHLQIREAMLGIMTNWFGTGTLKGY